MVHIHSDSHDAHSLSTVEVSLQLDFYKDRKRLTFCSFSCQALGCLLYRICYLKSAFDGESKLQVLNGNYRIPDSPKYSPSIINLIRDMLASSPDARPDITQASPIIFQFKGLPAWLRPSQTINS